MGPHTGGHLWNLIETNGTIISPIDTWHLVDGRVPHANLLFYGTRVSLVAFTHSSILLPGASHSMLEAAEHGFPVPSQAAKVDVPPALTQIANEGTL